MLFGRHRVLSVLLNKGSGAVIGKYGEKANSYLLAIMSEEESTGIKKMAAKALSEANYNFTSKEQHIDFLIAAQKFDELAQMGEDGFRALLSVLRHKNWDMREAAAHALMKTGEVSKKHFKSILKGKDIGARKIAATALKELGWSPNALQEDLDFYIADQNWDAVVNDFSLEQIAGQIKNEAYEVRYAIEEKIASVEGHFGQLVKLFVNGDDTVREGAELVLSEIYYGYADPSDYEESMKVILGLLSNPGKIIRLAALRILGCRGLFGMGGSENALSTINDVMKNDSETDIREEARLTIDLVEKHELATGLVVDLIYAQSWSTGCGNDPISCAQKLKSQMTLLQETISGHTPLIKYWFKFLSTKAELWDNPYVLIDSGMLLSPAQREMIPALKKTMMQEYREETTTRAVGRLDDIGFSPTNNEEWLVFKKYRDV